MKRFPENQLFIDMIKLKFPVRSEDSPLRHECPGYNWRIGVDLVAYTNFRVNLPGGSSVKIRAADLHGLFQLWDVEFNPSKFLYGENYRSGAERSELLAAVEQVLDHLHQAGYPKFSVHRGKVKRLDVAIDFDLDGVPSGPILQALASQPHSNRLKHTIFSGVGGAQTLKIGPGLHKMNERGNWHMRLYDRNALADPTRADGPLRVELQLDRLGLDRAEISDLASVLRVDLPGVMEDYSLAAILVVA